MIEIQVDTSKLESAMREFAKAGRKPLEKVVREQSGIFVGHLIALTPPGASKGQALTDRGGIDNSAKKRGEAVIAADIARLFPTSKLKPERLAAMVDNGFEFQTGKGRRVHVREVAESVEDLRRIHKFARHPKSGRTRTSGGVNMAVTRKALLRQYIMAEKKKVGRLNAGWIAAARELKTAGRAVPAWISRHGTRPGGVNVKAANGIVGVRVFNSQTWFPGNMEGRVRLAVARRTNGLEKALEAMLEREAARAQARMRG